jgi:hypothetical protein
VVVLSSLPYGLNNAATIHSRSMCPAMSSCTGLPKHRLHTTFELLATTLETSSTDSSEDSDEWAGADFSGLRDPKGLRRFMGACDYLFSFPNFDGEGHDPSHECFHVEVEEIAPGDATPVGQGVRAPLQRTLPIGPSQERATVSAPVGSQWAELEQLRELEAKVDEDYQQLVHLRATLEQGRSGQGDGGAA